MLTVQIFDQKKFKKRDQGFLGVVNVRVGNAIDLDTGGDGNSYLTRIAPDMGTNTVCRDAHQRPEEVE